MIAAAGGLRRDAALQRVKVERVLPPEARGPQTTARVTIDVPMTNGVAPRFALEDGDVVQVDSLAGASDQYTIAITGMVQQPGTYPWRPGMTLRQLMVLARGPRIGADLRDAAIVRLVDNRGRINIDLPKALREHDSRDNVILQPGDSIRIPEYQPSVRVTGAVNSPGSVLYRKGAGLDYYLSAAGGFTRNAEKGQVSVRYANGETRTKRRSFLFSSSPTPGPGSEVYIPAKDPNASKTDFVALFGAIAQILASTVAIIVVATR